MRVNVHDEVCILDVIYGAPVKTKEEQESEDIRDKLLFKIDMENIMSNIKQMEDK